MHLAIGLSLIGYRDWAIGLSRSSYRSHRDRAIVIALLGYCDRAIGLSALSSTVIVGIAIGIAGAAGVSRAFAALVFGVTTTEPAVYAAVALGLAALGVGASLVPAWRAAKADPLIALRAE